MITRKIISIIVGLALVLTAGITFIVWTFCRIYVPEGACAVLIKRTGESPPDGSPVAQERGQKGILPEPLGPGRHFRNPLTHEWEQVPLTRISAGDPNTWEWIHSLDKKQRDQLRRGRFHFRGQFPEVGVVTRNFGQSPPNGEVIVYRDSPYKGTLREVLTPGEYKINPKLYTVETHPAVVIPAGFVGVVTNRFGDNEIGGYEAHKSADANHLSNESTYSLASFAQSPDTTALGNSESAQQTKNTAQPAKSAADAEGNLPVEETTESAGSKAISPIENFATARRLAQGGERGTLRNVLQPGVYYINPRLKKVTLVEVGYNEYSQLKVSEGENYRISFPSDTGFDIRVGVTVVWGIHPRHAADIINEFGNIDTVLDKVIRPQLRSICRNIGSTYAARDFIQGEKRELFQRDLTDELHRVCTTKHVDVLLALVREIEVHAPNTTPDAGEVTEDLKRTIQESYIAIENQITKQKQREAAEVRAKLEEERKKIDIAQESIRAETRVMVANIDAEAEKEAATIDAKAQLEVARIQEEVAKLDAQRTEIIGQAKANIEKMRKQAEAQGFKLLVDAFGSPQAYNLYTFAENFEPESIRLFFAGEGTFWTDLSRFEEVGSAKIMQSAGKEQR